MATVDEEVLPLEPGDHLTRAEFFRRWEMHPEIKKAELIGGIVYMPGPFTRAQGETEGVVAGVLFTYMAATPGTTMGHNTSSFMLDDSLQADIHLRIQQEHGGSSWLEDERLYGSPELVVEVCKSGAAYDLHKKFELYQAVGVQEYLAILLHEKEARWHYLEKKKYRVARTGLDGIARSRVFPGLWLDGHALFAGKLDRVLHRLQEGLESPEHQAFVEKLRERRTEEQEQAVSLDQLLTEAGKWMSRDKFTLVLTGITELTPEIADKLYDATGGDIELNMCNGIPYLEFARTADSLQDAITVAIQEVESCDLGLRVVRVESEAANVIAKINAELLGATGVGK